MDEATLQKNALANNQAFVAALRSEAGFNSNAFVGVPESIYDDNTLRDAWGTPLVYMPAYNPNIGTALLNKPFFFSAGPDRKFLTQEDNLYSYEESNGEEFSGEQFSVFKGGGPPAVPLFLMKTENCGQARRKLEDWTQRTIAAEEAAYDFTARRIYRETVATRVYPAGNAGRHGDHADPRQPVDHRLRASRRQRQR